MQIKNQTRWKTEDLRGIFSRVLTEWNRTDPKRVPSKRLRITVVHGRDTHYSGYAYLRSGIMRLRLPAPERARSLTVADVGWLFLHELAHCAGYDHSQMGPLNHRVTKDRLTYLDGFPLGPQEPKATKPKPDVQATRYQQTVEALARWTTKLKRAQTALKKLKVRARYYERALASRPPKEG
jgi:hypothetical protein